jgi:hypothetical protein
MATNLRSTTKTSRSEQRRPARADNPLPHHKASSRIVQVVHRDLPRRGARWTYSYRPATTKPATVLTAVNDKPCGRPPKEGPSLTAAVRGGRRVLRSGRKNACGAVKQKNCRVAASNTVIGLTKALRSCGRSLRTRSCQKSNAHQSPPVLPGRRQQRSTHPRRAQRAHLRTPRIRCYELKWVHSDERPGFYPMTIRLLFFCRYSAAAMMSFLADGKIQRPARPDTHLCVATSGCAASAINREPNARIAQTRRSSRWLLNLLECTFRDEKSPTGDERSRSSQASTR